MNSVKKNFIYNLIYQLILFVFPLITVPYISRVLGADGVGIYSYTYSVVYYFMIITLLGISNHGNRSIAKVRDDKEKLSKTFFSIYSIQLVSGILMTILYSLYMIFINNSFNDIAWIQIIYIISAIFDINWFFFGMEEFKITITRNTLVKIISLLLMFVFVKTPNDVWIYTLIMTLSTLISQLLLLPFLFKRINFVKISFNDVKKHIKPVLLLFIPVVAVSIYRVMDKIMLGIMKNVYEVGLYEQADKIIIVPIAIISTLGTVMLPRISNLLSNNKIEEVLKYIDKSITFIMFLAFPMCFGLIAVADSFVPLFLGNNFTGSIILVKYMSIVIIFASFANVLRTQYLIPYEKDKIYVISIILGAIINVICNLIFIPMYSSSGALIGTIAAEFIVMFYQAMAIRKELPIKKYLTNIIPFFVSSLLMYIIVYSINLLNINTRIKLVIQVVLGIVIYFAFNYNYIKSIINIKRFRKKNDKK